MEDNETSRVPRQTSKITKDRLRRQIRIYEAAIQQLDKNHADDLFREVTEDFQHLTIRVAEGQDTGPPSEDAHQRKYDTHRIRGGALFRAHLQKEGISKTTRRQIVPKKKLILWPTIGANTPKLRMINHECTR